MFVYHPRKWHSWTRIQDFHRKEWHLLKVINFSVISIEFELKCQFFQFLNKKRTSCQFPNKKGTSQFPNKKVVVSSSLKDSPSLFNTSCNSLTRRKIKVMPRLSAIILLILILQATGLLATYHLHPMCQLKQSSHLHI